MGLLFDRGQGPGSNPQVPMTEVPLDGSPFHVTQFDPRLNQRVSWDTANGQDFVNAPHFTNQNLPKGHPGRHG